MNKGIGKVLVYLLLIAGAFAMFLPFLWMVSASLKTAGAVAMLPPQWIPNPIEWANYQMV